MAKILPKHTCSDLEYFDLDNTTFASQRSENLQAGKWVNHDVSFVQFCLDYL